MLTGVNKIPISVVEIQRASLEKREIEDFCLTDSTSLAIGLKIITKFPNYYESIYTGTCFRKAALCLKFSLRLSRIGIVVKTVWTLVSLKIFDQELCKLMKSFIYHKNKTHVSLYSWVTMQLEMAVFSGEIIFSLCMVLFVIGMLLRILWINNNIPRLWWA